MGVAKTREKGLLLRLSDEERELLEALADAMSLKLSDTVRQAIREAARKRGLAVAATPNRKRRRP